MHRRKSAGSGVNSAFAEGRFADTGVDGAGRLAGGLGAHCFLVALTIQRSQEQLSDAPEYNRKHIGPAMTEASLTLFLVSLETITLLNFDYPPSSSCLSDPPANQRLMPSWIGCLV